MVPVLAVNPDWKVKRRLDVLELGQAGLELLVEGHRAGDGANRARPGTQGLGREDRRLPQLRMGGQPQVVVRREGDDLLAVDPAAGRLLALHHPQAPVQALGPQLVEVGVEEGQGVAAHGTNAFHGRSTTLPAWRDPRRSKPCSQSARSNRWVRMGATFSAPDRNRSWVRSHVS